jgi:Fibronectin type III domain
VRQLHIASRSFVAALVAIAVLLPSATIAQSGSTHGAEVSAAVRHDVSKPLGHLTPSAPSAAKLRERPLRLVGPGSSPNTPDGAVQQGAGAAAAATPGTQFAGIGNGDYGFSPQYAPPDTNGAVGATQYVQWVNVNFAIFDKATGAILYGPAPGNTIWQGFGGACETDNAGDPIVQYDKLANRWILTQFTAAATPYLQCVAVSTSSDALGTYNRYAFSYGTVFPDYPKLGVWPDAYYITFNMFTNTFQGAKACAYDRAAMLAGASATQQCFQLGTSYAGLLPGDVDGTNPPPAGEANPVLNFGTNSLNLWRFHVDWGNAGNTTFSGPVSIPVASFSRACNGSNCVPQPGTSQKLDSLGDRLMYRLAYRHFADGHESLVVNHSVGVGGNIFNPGISSVRWYELRNATGQTIGSATPVVYQQSTLGTSDNIHRWMGSAAMDQAGNIAVGYSASNASVYPSIRYTGRLATDPLNTMQAETIVKAGTGSQLQNLSRWGDYSAMTVDPVDDCTFWYTNEYLKTNGTWNWSTWITSFTFPGCGGQVTPDFGISATPTSRSVSPGTGTTYTVTVTPTGGAGPVSLSASGFPAGAAGSFALNPTSSMSTFSVTTSASTPTGTFPLAITGTSGSVTHSTSVDLVVTPASTATVPGAPAAPSVSPANGKGVNVSWSPPSSDGGSPITGYRVYRGATSDTATMAPLTTLGNVTSFKDTSTSRGATYFYAVSAINAVGEGAKSPASAAVRAK